MKWIDERLVFAEKFVRSKRFRYGYYLLEHVVIVRCNTMDQIDERPSLVFADKFVRLTWK